MKSRVLPLRALIACALCCASAFFCVSIAQPQFAFADQTGSISLTSCVSASEANADAILPDGATPIAGDTFTLYKLSDFAASANGDNPQVTVDSPPLSSFPAQTCTSDATGVALFSNLNEGVYLIKQEAPQGYEAYQSSFLVAVPMVAQSSSGGETWNVDVYPKLHQLKTITLESLDNNVLGVGDQPKWRINLVMPNDLRTQSASGETVYASQLAFWLQLDGCLDCAPTTGSTQFSVIDASGNEVVMLTEGDDYTTSYDAALHRAAWSCTDAGIKKIADASAGRTISILASSQVNESAFDVMGNVSGIAGYTQTLPTSAVRASTAIEKDTSSIAEDSNEASIVIGGIAVDKFLRGSAERLKDAHFKIARTREDAAQGVFIQRLGVNNALPTDIELITDARGHAEVGGMGFGTYVLVETQAPHVLDDEGQVIECVLLTDPIDIEVSNDVSQNIVTAHIENHTVQDQTLAETAAQTLSRAGGLPQTGDNDIRFIALFLGILASIACLVCVHWRQCSKN